MNAAVSLALWTLFVVAVLSIAAAIASYGYSRHRTRPRDHRNVCPFCSDGNGRDVPIKWPDDRPQVCPLCGRPTY